MYGIQIFKIKVSSRCFLWVCLRSEQVRLSEVILRYFITRSWCKHFNTRSRQS